MRCRVCGCTDGAACVLDEHNNLVDVDELGLYTLLPGLHQCSWIEPDLCSGCIASPAPPLLVDQFGNPLRGAP